MDRTPELELICAALSGREADWPLGASEELARALPSMLALHGVGPLLHHTGVPATWPHELRAHLRDLALAAARWELQHENQLRQLLAALDAAGVAALLMKGTALAYSLYVDPALRTRGDTDILVQPDDRHRAETCLSALGFLPQLTTGGQVATSQRSWTRTAADGSRHTIDLHWRTNNSAVLAALFPAQELFDHSQPLPRLGIHARAPSLPHSLLFACVHKATHAIQPYYVDSQAHFDAERLVWLYDIHLLAKALAPNWEDVEQMAIRKGLTAVAHDALEVSRAAFGTTAPTIGARARSRETSWRYLHSGPMRQALMDVQAMGGVRTRLQWLRETLCPPASYMSSRFGYQPGAPLLWAYVKRAASGLARRAKRS